MPGTSHMTLEQHRQWWSVTWLWDDGHMTLGHYVIPLWWSQGSDWSLNSIKDLDDSWKGYSLINLLLARKSNNSMKYAGEVKTSVRLQHASMEIGQAASLVTAIDEDLYCSQLVGSWVVATIGRFSPCSQTTSLLQSAGWILVGGRYFSLCTSLLQSAG